MGNNQICSNREAERSETIVNDKGNNTSRPNAAISTFLCSSLQDLSKHFEELVHDDLRSNLDSVILLSIGYTAFDLQPFSYQAWRAGAKVYYVDSYGVLGWHSIQKKNVEFEEKGRGSEYGAPGHPSAFPGVVLVAVRREPDPRVVVTDEGNAPTLEEGAGCHNIIARFENQPETERFMNSGTHAVGIGGFCKKVMQLNGREWENRKMVILTFMRRPDTTVNVCHSYAVYDTAGAKPASQVEGKLLASTMPAGYEVSFISNYQCFMRGWNAFSKPNVEADGLSGLFGKDIPTFGMYCFGEIGNNKNINPNGWNATHKSSEVTWLHSFCSLFCVYAEKKNRVRRINVELTNDEVGRLKSLANAREAAIITSTDHLSFDKLETYKPKSVEVGANAYKNFLRGITFKDVGVPDAEGIDFWIFPDGMEVKKRFGKSKALAEVDVFVSHVLRPDPKAPLNMMRTPIKYSVHKCVDIFIGSHSICVGRAARGEIKQSEVGSALGDMTYWVDMASVDPGDVARKMYILKAHLKDFVTYAKNMLMLVGTSYFTRLWCIYEFACACELRSDLSTIIISNTCLAFFESERDAIVNAIYHVSVKNSNCFDPRDRVMIEEKVQEGFKNFESFERFTKFSACALCAKACAFWAAENYDAWLSQWGDLARRCNFADLAQVIEEFPVQKLRSEMYRKHPDVPAETKTIDRLAFAESSFVMDWFKSKVEPMVHRELSAARKSK